MKNMVFHKTCFQSPTLQNMATARFVEKEKPLSLEGSFVSLLTHIPEWSWGMFLHSTNGKYK